MSKPKTLVISFVAGAIALAALVIMAMRLRVHAIEMDRRLNCGSNIKRLAQALMIYARDGWDGITPPIDFLRSRNDVDPSLFICSVSGKANYVLVPWRPDEPLGNRAIVAHEPSSNHLGKGGHVVFADGDASFVRSPQLEQMIASIPKQRPH